MSSTAFLRRAFSSQLWQTKPAARKQRYLGVLIWRGVRPSKAWMPT